MNIWARVHFLFWTKRWSWSVFDVSYTGYYPNNSTNPYKSSSVLRSYASDYKRSTLALPGSIINDVAENAYPRYLSDGNSILFQNLKTPEELNDDRLSVYSSNGTADLLPTAALPSFGFDVASNASGATVVAYEQMSDSIRPIDDNVSEETYMQTQSNNVDIYATVKNGSTWQTKQLSDVNVSTEHKRSDMTPKTAISADGSTAAVVWTSGVTQVDTEEGGKINGQLMMSRYKNSAWSSPLSLMSAENLGDYSVAIDGDSVVVAAVRTITTPSEDNPEENEKVSKIRLISVSETDEVSYIETNRLGSKPQIVRTGDNYYVSFMSARAKDDSTNVSDVYMLAIEKNGQILDSLSGFANMSKSAFGYKLVSDNNAQSISDLGIIYNTSKIVGDGEIENSLLAAKFGVENGKFYTSEPDTILTLPDDGEQDLVSFDGYKQGDALKTAALIANSSLGAIVVEKSTQFANKITCLAESYNLSAIKNGEEFKIEFYMLNAGFSPVTSLSVSVNGENATISNETVLPGAETIVKGSYTVPADNSAPVPYSITATFADGSTNTTTGSLDLTSYQMKVKLLSLKNSDTNNTAVVEVINNSSSPLTAQHEVTVGVYQDIFGETLYPGTSLKTLSYSDFYGVDENNNTVSKAPTTAFDIPTVDETVSVYAIAKVKKKNVMRSPSGVATETTADVEQTDKTYASIQLFPTQEVVTGIKPIDNVKDKDSETGLKIYVRNGCAVIEGQLTEPVKVYSVTGVLHKVVEPNPSETTTVIPLSKGIYVIESGGKAGKVVI
jgi:hypothetical protein